MRSLLTATMLALALALAVPAAAQQQGPGNEPDPAITDGTAQHALDAARSRWHKAHIAGYRFRVQRSCFCVADALRARTVTVRHGKPVKPPKYYGEVATVTRLFAVVQDAIHRKAASLVVEYGAHGVPRHIAVDYERLTVDEEVSYAVDRFARLRR